MQQDPKKKNPKKTPDVGQKFKEVWGAKRKTEKKKARHGRKKRH